MTAVRRLTDSFGRRSWTVVTDDGLPIGVVDDYLAYLLAIERSPDTQRAYAYDLRAFFEYLHLESLDYADVTNEHLAFFVQHLRRPAPDVALLTGEAAIRTETTVNRIMTGVSGFYRFLGDRDDLPAAKRLATRARNAVRAEKALLAGVAGRSLDETRIGPRLRTTRRELEVLTIAQARSIVDACRTHRDRLFFTLLATTGMRRGQVLGLRHSDVDTRARTISIRHRDDNVNGARAKNKKEATIPISRDVARLYLDYMHREYGSLDSDYVFVTLSGPTAGQPLNAEAVDAIVKRLRRRVNLDGWSCHTFRHTFATLHHRAGMRLEIISHLLTHGSLSTTADIYSHLDVDDLRAQLEEHGCWEPA